MTGPRITDEQLDEWERSNPAEHLRALIREVRRLRKIETAAREKHAAELFVSDLHFGDDLYLGALQSLAAAKRALRAALEVDE